MSGNAETPSYTVKDVGSGETPYKGSNTNYGLTANVNPLTVGGHSGGSPAILSSGGAGTQVGGSFTEGTLPEIPENFSIGEDKNVSTPVSGL